MRTRSRNEKRRYFMMLYGVQQSIGLFSNFGGRGVFFAKFDVEDATVDWCAIEAYEAAISEYRDNNHPDGAGLIAKYCLQPQATGALIKCRQVVSAVVAICGSSLF